EVRRERAEAVRYLVKERRALPQAEGVRREQALDAAVDAVGRVPEQHGTDRPVVADIVGRLVVVTVVLTRCGDDEHADARRVQVPVRVARVLRLEYGSYDAAVRRRSGLEVVVARVGPVVALVASEYGDRLMVEDFRAAESRLGPAP